MAARPNLAQPALSSHPGRDGAAGDQTGPDLAVWSSSGLLWLSLSLWFSSSSPVTSQDLLDEREAEREEEEEELQ